MIKKFLPLKAKFEPKNVPMRLRTSSGEGTRFVIPLDAIHSISELPDGTAQIHWKDGDSNYITDLESSYGVIISNLARIGCFSDRKLQ